MRAAVLKTRTNGWRYKTRMIVVLGFMFGIVFFDRNAMAFLGPFVAKDLQLDNSRGRNARLGAVFHLGTVGVG